MGSSPQAWGSLLDEPAVDMPSSNPVYSNSGISCPALQLCHGAWHCWALVLCPFFECNLILSCAGCSSSDSLFFCAFKGELHWGIDETAAQLERVLNLYKSGEYLQNTTRVPKAGKLSFLKLKIRLYLWGLKGQMCRNVHNGPWNHPHDNL